MRPTKRIWKQLDSIDAQIRKSRDNTPFEKKIDLEDLTEPKDDLGEHTEFEISASSYITQSVIEDATISTSLTGGRLSTTRITDQLRYPYFLRSCHKKNVEINQEDA